MNNQPGRKTTILNRATFMFALILALAGGDTRAKESSPPPKVSVSDRPVDRNAKLPSSFAPIVKKVAPCVVNVYSTRKITEQPFNFPFFDDPLFRQYFDQLRRYNRPQTRRELSGGSGVIVSEDGYILTNNHVVDGADDIKVVLSDGKTRYTARVIGRDPQTDVAVIKVDGKKLPAITMGDSDQVEVGDFVLAVGNPFGVGQSVSKGIVSALSRGSGILGEHGFEDFIQTDAPINPGNSGGALVDIEGRLIGINQSIMSRSGGSQGVGFAVPVNLARSVMDRLISDGKITRGYLGVSIQPVTQALAKKFKLDSEDGAFVGDVTPETPAAKAGIQVGDVITEFNSKKVSDAHHLRLLVAQTAPKSTASIKVLRNGHEQTLSATLGILPDELGGQSDEGESHVGQSGGFLDGVELSDLDSRSRQENDIPGNIHGAFVMNVDPDSAAADAGLRTGDVIVEVEREPARSADAVRELARKAGGDGLVMRVWSKAGGFGATRYLVIEAAKKK